MRFNSGKCLWNIRKFLCFLNNPPLKQAHNQRHYRDQLKTSDNQEHLSWGRRKVLGEKGFSRAHITAPPTPKHTHTELLVQQRMGTFNKFLNKAEAAGALWDHPQDHWPRFLSLALLYPHHTPGP